MMSYLWIFLLATLVSGVKAQDGDVAEDQPEDAAPEETVAPEAEETPSESSPTNDAAATDDGDPEEEVTGAAPVEEDAPADDEPAAPEATEEEETPSEGGPTPEDDTAPEATSAPSPSEEAEGGAEAGVEEDPTAADPATDTTSAPEEETEKEEEPIPEEGEPETPVDETSEDVATEAPMSKEEANPVEGGFDLSDALEGANEPSSEPEPVEGQGKARSAGAASGPDGAEEPKEAGSGQIAGILSAIGVAIVGAASGYFAYQKKKLCFKQQEDPETATHKEDPGTQTEPQVLSNLLSSS